MTAPQTWAEGNLHSAALVGRRSARSGVSRLGFKAWALMAWLLLVAVNLPAQTAVTKEYQVKAAFLFNFAQFVEWPPEAFPEKETPLVIGVLGEDPFKGFLREMLRDEKVSNRPLRIEYFRRVEDIKDCHILFISNSESRRLEMILPKLKDRSILTVGETDSFAANGGMIKFFMEANKVRFRINNESARAGKLSISSKLLRLAEGASAPKN